MRWADLYYVEKQLHHRALLSAAEDSPHGIQGMDDEPYKSAKEEPYDVSSVKSLERGIEMSSSSDMDSEEMIWLKIQMSLSIRQLPIRNVDDEEQNKRRPHEKDWVEEDQSWQTIVTGI